MEEEVVNKKAEEDKKKKRTSLKSILGGDILATDFRSQPSSMYFFCISLRTGEVSTFSFLLFAHPLKSRRAKHKINIVLILIELKTNH